MGARRNNVRRTPATGARGVTEPAGLFYDPDGNEITLAEWCALGCGAEPGFSLVALTTTAAGVRISTVWFGINIGRNDPPLIFETMVSGPQGEVFHRWPSRAAAEEGHAELVARYGLPEPEPERYGYGPAMVTGPINEKEHTQ